jgi:hypothetical protein
VAGHSEEIGRGRGLLTQNGSDRAWTLDSAWPIELRGGGHRGGTEDGVDMRGQVVAGRNGDIRGGVNIRLQN